MAWCSPISASPSRCASSARSSASSRRRVSAARRCRPIPASGSRCASAREVGRRIERAGADSRPYRHRRADRLGGAAPLPAARPAVHDELPHPLSRICRRPPAGAAGLELRLSAALPRAGRAHPGADAVDEAGVGAARLRQRRAMDARRRPRRCSGRATPRRSTCRGRYSSMSAGWRWRRTWRRSSSLDLPGSKVVVGDGPALAGAASANIRKTHFLGEKFGERARRDFRQRRRVRVSLAHRHVRRGADRGAGERPAGRGLSRDRPARRDRRFSGAGALDEDLRRACLAALDIPRERARARSLEFTWRESARQFVEHVTGATRERRRCWPRLFRPLQLLELAEHGIDVDASPPRAASARRGAEHVAGARRRRAARW